MEAGKMIATTPAPDSTVAKSTMHAGGLEETLWSDGTITWCFPQSEGLQRVKREIKRKANGWVVLAGYPSQPA
jgi:hypothetical protein